MKHIQLALCISLLIVSQSCSKNNVRKDEDTGTWIARSTFNGTKRSEAVCFTLINGSDTGTYAVTGFNTSIDGENDSLSSLRALWKCVRSANGDIHWTNLKSIDLNLSEGAKLLFGAIAFGIGKYGYVGTGKDEKGKFYKEFYRYDASLNEWSSHGNFSPFPGQARIGAVGFAINGKGYIATGTSPYNTLSDCYEYDPSSGWLATPTSVPGSNRTNAVAFVINNKAYIVTGAIDGQPVYDFSEFDPARKPEPWMPLDPIKNESAESFDNEYTDIARSDAVAFVIGNQAYLATGLRPDGGFNNKTWMFDPNTREGKRTWHRRLSYPADLGPGRKGAIAFSVNSLGYIGLGNTGTDNTSLETFASFNPR